MDNDCFNDLVIAYYNTNYRIVTPEIVIEIGRPCQALKDFASENNIDKWAVITAHNPASVALSSTENARRDKKLRLRLEELGKKYFDLIGEAAPPSDWPPEKGYFAGVDSLEEAVEMAADFGQHAILYGDECALPSIVWVDLEGRVGS